MPHATGNQVSIYYEVHGNNGSPLLMIMGAGASIADWLPEQIQQLRQKHRVILFDNRGMGQSDKPSTAYSMTDLALDAISVLDAIKIDKAHVFGVSLGGAIAQHVVLDHPARVLGVILGCTICVADLNHPKIIPPSQEILIELMKPPSGNRFQDMESGWQRVFTPSFIEHNRELLNRLRDNSLAYPEASAESHQLQSAAIFGTHNTYDRIANIQHPTLIQTGTDDILVPAENSRVMARLMPNARLIEYPDWGHGYVVEGGEKVIDDILTFLAEVDNTVGE